MPLPLLAIALVAGAGAAASYFGAKAQADASVKAAKLVSQSEDKAIQAQLDMFYKGLETQMPWINAGKWALDELVAGRITPQNIESSPLLQFRLKEGEKTIKRQMASMGLGVSGAAIEALSGYTAKVTGEEADKAYERGFNRLSALAQLPSGIGQQTAATGQALSNIYSTSGTNLANIELGRGQASADFATNIGNIGTSSLGTYLQARQNEDLIKALSPRGTIIP